MTAKARKNVYDNESISSLKGADRVRKRPGVIFGSDGLEGCQHSVFEILSNAIDEARQGHGGKIIVTRFKDNSIEVHDFGRGCPVDYNAKEERYNWELVFCELYAGGKYDGQGDGSYEYSLGLNGLGSCATQYSSEYMDVEVIRDGFKYNLHFEKGENIGGLAKEPTRQKQTGTKIRWKPDLEVFTDITIPEDYFLDIMKRQAVVNSGVELLLRSQKQDGSFEETMFCYNNGIQDYCTELAGDEALTPVQMWSGDRVGRDREDKPDYKVKLNVALCFSNKNHVAEYYHNS
ncbi:MAG: ATP-binding protein, partial [Angelakisella sp.]